MKRKMLVVLAILAVTCWAGSAFAVTLNAADNYTATFNTSDGSLSSVVSELFSGSATAVFKLVNPGVIGVGTAGAYLDIVLTNNLATPTNASVLSGVFWTSTDPFFSGLGAATGTIVNPVTGSSALSTFWGYGSGGTYYGAGNQGVAGVGLGITTGAIKALNDATTTSTVDGIDYTIVGSGTVFVGPGPHVSASPVVSPSVEIQLFASGLGTYTFTDPESYWGTKGASGVPIPPSALLLGSGLLGLVGFGWRKRG